MGISKAALKPDADVYVDYPFENVMFRWDSKALSIYRRFYGEAGDERPIPFDNRLFNDALAFGDEINEKVYFSGKRVV